MKNQRLPYPPGGFDSLFTGSKVADIENDLPAIKNVDPEKNWPMLIMFYHPKCGASVMAAKYYKELADYVYLHDS